MVPNDPKNPCKISDYKIDGNKVSWTADCPKMKATGKGELTFGEDSYTGTMKLTIGDRQMTQKTLAELASLNYKYVGRVELGKADPGADVLVRLARALAVPVGELFETITPAGATPRWFPVADVEGVTVALQALTAAIDRLVSHQPRPTGTKTSGRSSR